MISNNNKLLTIQQQYKDTYHLLLEDAEKYVYRYIKKMYDKYQVIIIIGELAEYNPKKLYQLHLDQMINNKFIQTNIIGQEDQIFKYLQGESGLKAGNKNDVQSLLSPVDSNLQKIAQQYETLAKNYKETPEKKYLTKDGRDISWRAKDYDMDGYETGEWAEPEDDGPDDEYNDEY